MMGQRGDILSEHNENQKIFDGIMQDIPGQIGVEWYGSIIQLVMEIKGIIFDGIQQEIKRYTSNE